jgi:N-acetylglucosamine malate deacetylase 1
MIKQIEALAFAPHPDDAELGCAGTLLRLKHAGMTTAVVDLSEGELSTRGTPETRKKETEAASFLLDLDARINLKIPDGNLVNTPEHRLRIISVLRELRPRIVFLPFPRDRHPDHEHASSLIKDAAFYSGLEKIRTDPYGETQPAHRPERLYYYILSTDFEPSFIVDISDTFEKKLEAIRAYQTQFFVNVTGAPYPETYISGSGYMEAFIARARRLGFSIGKKYGEGFVPLQALEVAPTGL